MHPICLPFRTYRSSGPCFRDVASKYCLLKSKASLNQPSSSEGNQRDHPSSCNGPSPLLSDEALCMARRRRGSTSSFFPMRCRHALRLETAICAKEEDKEEPVLSRSMPHDKDSSCRRRGRASASRPRPMRRLESARRIATDVGTL